MVTIKQQRIHRQIERNGNNNDNYRRQVGAVHCHWASIAKSQYIYGNSVIIT